MTRKFWWNVALGGITDIGSVCRLLPIPSITPLLSIILNRRSFIATSLGVFAIPALSIAGYTYRKPVMGATPINRISGVIANYQPDGMLAALYVELPGGAVMSWWAYQFMAHPPYPHAFRIVIDNIIYRRLVPGQSDGLLSAAATPFWQALGVSSAHAAGSVSGVSGDPDDLDCIDKPPLSNAPSKLKLPGTSTALGGSGSGDFNFTDDGSGTGFRLNYTSDQNPNATASASGWVGKPGAGKPDADVTTTESAKSKLLGIVKGGGVAGTLVGLGAGAAAANAVINGNATVYKGNVGGGTLTVKTKNGGQGGSVNWELKY